MKRYRFSIDLRPGGEPELAPQPPSDGYTPSGKVPPLPLAEPEPEQVPEEMVVAYQKLRQDLERRSPGKTRSDHVFVDRQQRKHHLQRRSEGLVEIRLEPDGHLVRRVYERVLGPNQDLDDLFQRGMSGLDGDEKRFRSWPGYELRFTRYHCRQGKVVKVVMGSAAWIENLGQIQVLTW